MSDSVEPPLPENPIEVILLTLEEAPLDEPAESVVDLTSEHSAPARIRETWCCPVCIGVRSAHPGNCPRCGLAMLSVEVRVDGKWGNPELRSMNWRLLLGLFLTLLLLIVSADGLIGTKDRLGLKWFFTIQAILATPVVFICGWPILVRAWRSIRTLRPNFFTLTGLGIGAAFLFSTVAVVYAWSDLPLVKKPVEPSIKLAPAVAGGIAAIAPSTADTVDPFFEAAALIVVLTLLGQILELRARARTEIAIRKLMQLVPDRATVVLSSGQLEVRDLAEVIPGDRVRVGPGERIPVDGIVREGTSNVDESLLTGEAARSGRRPGMHVSAGSENGLGTIVVEALRVRDESALGQIILLVDQGMKNRNPLQRTVDKLIRWLIPFALLASIITFGIWVLVGGSESIASGLACAVGVLVVSCPVALGLATPTAVAVGMSRATKTGILFRDGAALERFAEINAILFDKTGTLTEGKMKLAGAVPNVFVSEEELLRLAASVERGNEHPIGLAIVWGAVAKNIEMIAAESVVEIPGQGVRGVVDGKRIAVGTQKFLRESGCDREFMLAEARSKRLQGHNVVFVARDNACIGIIHFEDKIRDDAKIAVKDLQGSGIRLVLLTGDHDETAQAVSMQLGINEVIADTMPVEKYAVVERLKKEGHLVAMCGDGINDAPALAAADVGIAMGTGSPAAISIAGVTLVRPDLRVVELGRELSRATVARIRQNLFLAFAFTIVAIPIAAGILIPFGGGILSPGWGAVAMVISSLLIVLNPLRRSKGLGK